MTRRIGETGSLGEARGIEKLADYKEIQRVAQELSRELGVSVLPLDPRVTSARFRVLGCTATDVAEVRRLVLRLKP